MPQINPRRYRGQTWPRLENKNVTRGILGFVYLAGALVALMLLGITIAEVIAWIG